MKAHWEGEAQVHELLTSALDKGGWPASGPGRFTARERAPRTRGRGGRVGPRACQDAMV